MGQVIDKTLNCVYCKQTCATVRAYNPAADYGEITEPFVDTGSKIVSMLFGYDYQYYTRQDPLTATHDVRHMYRILERADQSACTVVCDYDIGSPGFPTKQLFVHYLRGAASKCRPGDWFVFFYGGHGENMSGSSRIEMFGVDQAFVTPTPDGNIAREASYLVDDQFALALDQCVPPGVKILCLIDCCHSGSICDIDSYRYTHEIYCLSACKDDQEAEDTGSGGVFTQALGYANHTLSTKYGANKEWSIQEMFDVTDDYARAAITTNQALNFTWSGTSPARVAWPLGTTLSAYFSGAHHKMDGQKIDYHGIPADFLKESYSS
mmetsp:Transcript_97518/g.172657  ORF Transcript_97518/g.172657 Transcript_97518/m.172657 type:complete len:322 (-) Transcript_97518:81-1046(-)